MTTTDHSRYDPSGEIPLDPSQLSALAGQLYAQLSGVTTGATRSERAAVPEPSAAAEYSTAAAERAAAPPADVQAPAGAQPLTGAEWIPSPPATAPTVDTGAWPGSAGAEAVARRTLAESLPPVDPARALAAVAPVGVPGVAGIASFAVPQVAELLFDPILPESPWQQSEPDYFVLGDVQRSGSIEHRVLDNHQVFDVESIRRDFPILGERVNGHQLVWLDNAATTQKPEQVIERLSQFYRHENSNVHRAAHELAARATNAYEDARETVARFIGAGSANDIVFVRGTTEAINLVAQSWGGAHIGEGDEILITHLEHHANIVPWQLLAKRTGAVLKVAPVDDSGTLDLSAFESLLGPRTKLVSVTHVSNALGTVNPVQQIVELGHRYGARVLIDAAQSVPHVRLDVRQLGADFLVFSGHKIFGPTGIGVLYGTPEALAETPPWQGGGNMIADVTLERAIFHGPPNKFEAGTGNIADAVGLGAALRYVESIGIERIARHEHALLEYATPRLAAIDGVRLVGTATEKASVLSFVLAGHDTVRVGQQLNEFGIAVRAGHHCAQPILRRLGLEATVRPSFAFYNTFEEADRFVEAVDWIAQHPA